jgi:ribosomal protein S18 acetylase RimI-like enzyme
LYRGEGGERTPFGDVAEFWSQSKKSAEQYGPNLRVRTFNPEEHRILDADSLAAERLVAEFSGEKIATPEDYQEISAEHFMFPTPEWAKFLRSHGYDATKFGNDYAFLRETPGERAGALIKEQEARPLSAPEENIRDAEELRGWAKGAGKGTENARMAGAIAEEIDEGVMQPIFLRDSEGKILSAAAIDEDPVSGDMHVAYIATHPELGRRGHATTLLDQAFERARDAQVGLTLSPTAQSAGFWRRMGAHPLPHDEFGWTAQEVAARTPGAPGLAKPGKVQTIQAKGGPGKLQDVGVVTAVLPSKVAGKEILELRTPEGYTSRMAFDKGRFNVGDTIRGTKVPLRELLRGAGEEKPAAPREPGTVTEFRTERPISIMDLKAPVPKATTGQPVEFDAYRASMEPQIGPRGERGTFFAPEATPEHGEHIFSARLRFENPLVVRDGVEAAKFFNRPGLAEKYENVLSGMSESGEEPMTGTGGWDALDKELIEHARAHGYDGIIFTEHDDLNPTQYIALKESAIGQVRSIGKFNWKTGMVDPPQKR